MDSQMCLTGSQRRTPGLEEEQEEERGNLRWEKLEPREQEEEEEEEEEQEGRGSEEAGRWV